MATQAQLEASIKKVVEPLLRNQVWAYKGAQPKDAFWYLVHGTWAKTVNRGGKQISALQELADAKTLGQQNAAAIAQLNGKLDALIKAVGAQQPAAPRAAAEPEEVLVDLGELEAPGVDDDTRSEDERADDAWQENQRGEA